MINFLSLAVPLAILMIYDRIIPNKSLPTLAVLIAGIAVVIGIDLVLRLTRLSLESRLTARLDHLARTRHVEALLSRKNPSRISMSLDDLLRSLSQSSPGLARKMLFIKNVADIPFAFAFLGMIGLIAGKLVLLPIGICLVFGIWAILLGMSHRKAIRTLRTSSAQKRDFVDRVFDSLAQIKILAVEIPLLNRLSRLYERQAFWFRNQKQYSMTIGNVYGLFSQIMIGGVVVAGSCAVLDGDLSHGGLAAFTLLAGRALEPMRSVYELAIGGGRNDRDAKSSARLGTDSFETLSGKADKRLFKQAPLIRAQCWTRDERDKTVLDIDLTIKSGETIAITSKSSQGKTALVHTLLGLRSYTGSVSFDKIVLGATNADEIRDQITVIGRAPQLPRGPMMDVLSCGMEDRYADVRYLCHLIGLDILVKRLPEGYSTLVGDDPTKLPEGLLQQVAIVRGLAANNKVIIVDDATLPLDARTELRFTQILKMLKKRATIIILSDRPSLTGISDRVLVVENTKIISRDQNEEPKKHSSEDV
ncbi:ATP-binding cassette domain-containing protein [Thalassospira mesophila]|nr:ATP-binding cassette domain-containing protein [Thalassospira mesophila]